MRLARVASWTSAALLTFVASAVGCGRSQIPDATSDDGGSESGSSSGASGSSSGPSGSSSGFSGSGSGSSGSSGSGSSGSGSGGFGSSSGGSSGSSSGSPGSCGPENCAGCCDGTTCIWPNQSASQCGFAGVACAPCGAGGTCQKGACLYPRPNCGPANCTGCCVDANTCSDGTAADACGFGGAQCEGCGPQGNVMQCVPQPGGGGSCRATCGPADGCNGCCNGATCELGQSTSSCGTGGAPCAACAKGEICAVQGPGGGGLCQEPCSPSTCAGCCQGEVCAVGNQDIACGTGGGVCSDCTAQSYLCVNGMCQP